MKLMCLSLVLAMVAAMAGGQEDDSLHSVYFNVLASPADRGSYRPPGAPIDLTPNTISGADATGAGGAATGTATAGSTKPNRIPPGKCPPTRTFCPSPQFLPTPKPCVFDSHCFKYQKCCYDRCYRRRVCKTRFFG